MKKRVLISALVAGILLTPAFAAKKDKHKATENVEPTAKTIDISQISDVNFMKNPAMNVKQVVDMGSFYQARASAKTPYGEQNFDIFITKDKKYVFLGTGFIDKSGTKLTTPYEKQEQAEFLKKQIEKQKSVASYLPTIESDAAFTYGNGTKKFYIFTDPECPFCKKMEMALVQSNKLADAKFYFFFMPLPMHQNAKQMSLYVLNSETPFKSLISIADGSVGDTYKEIKCTNTETNSSACTPEKMKILEGKLDKQMSFSRQLGVNGTPTIYDEHGQFVNWMELLGTK